MEVHTELRRRQDASGRGNPLTRPRFALNCAPPPPAQAFQHVSFDPSISDLKPSVADNAVDDRTRDIKKDHSLRSRKRKPHLKPGRSWRGLDRDLASVLANNPARCFEAQTRTVADSLGSEEWLEDVIQNFRRNTWPIIGDLDERAIQFAGGADAQLTLSVHGVHSVIDQVCPHLVEFAPVRANARQGTVKIQLYLNSVLEAIAQHDERILQAVVDIDLLLGALIHVRVLFHGPDQLGNPGAGMLDFIQQAANGQRGGDARQ